MFSRNPRKYGKALYVKLRRVQMRYATPVHTKKVWDAGLHDEVTFWDKFLATGGMQWKNEFRRMTSDRGPIVDQLITRELDRSPSDRVSILDVGAGPLSVVGTSYPGKVVSVTAIDPLGDEYNALLAKHDIKPPVRTTRCAAERLLERFEPESFDLAYARNSLDHSYDPIAAIANMIQVTKKTGVVLMRHHPHEGENIRYFGLHQWNFDIEHGCFVIWSRGIEHNLTRMLEGQASVSCEQDDAWITCTIRKTSVSTESIRPMS